MQDRQVASICPSGDTGGSELVHMKALESTCEVKVRGVWTTIGLKQVLRWDNDREKRCPECRGQVRRIKQDATVRLPILNTTMRIQVAVWAAPLTAPKETPSESSHMTGHTV